MRPLDSRIIAILAAAAALITGCGGGSSPTRPDTPRASCADPVFGESTASPYCLPYAAGATYTVTQSYCSTGSHAGRFAYDFDMPMGTEVLAARAGEVVELREHWSDQDTRGGHENRARFSGRTSSIPRFAPSTSRRMGGRSTRMERLSHQGLNDRPDAVSLRDHRQARRGRGMGEVWRARDTRIDGPGVPAHTAKRIWELLSAGHVQPAP